MDETRLSCPGCGAEYRLDRGLIPPGGRQVECSSCSRSWFYDGADASKAQPQDAEGADTPRLNRPLPPDVLEVLLAEARHERAARTADAAVLRPVGQPASAPARVNDPKPPVLPAEPPATSAHHINTAPHSAPADPAPDEMEATVTRTTPSRAPLPLPAAAPAATVANIQARRRGLHWGLGLTAACLALYLAAPYLAESGALADARDGVDDARLWLFDRFTAVVDPAIRALR